MQKNIDTLQILQRYWGYSEFRPLQNDIIDTVISQRDVLALLPTGGGKSLCFQVPALAMEGVCIVISPLVALMQDQVARLKKLGIRAESLHSGMGRRDIDRILDNCIYGNVKMLYISPERLQSYLAQERIKQMNVSFVAIDEAHCISQWGHDFRPAYLKIPVIREWHPGVPILALTATATTEVANDIIEHLGMSEPVKFRSSFRRPNLNFAVHETDNKPARLIETLHLSRGSGIVYVRSRSKTIEVAKLLVQAGLSCESYHAGMSFKARAEVQERWITNKTQIIACTTAFGMGIDKPDVRAVIHYDLPTSLEEYYQEAGRAGRDGNQSACVLLFNAADIKRLKDSVSRSHPTSKDVLGVYRGLVTQFFLPVDSDEPIASSFDLNAFCKRFRVDAYTTYHCLRILAKEGWIILSESIHSPSRLQVIVTKDKLYRAQAEDITRKEVMTSVLRSYEGVFLEPVRILESTIARVSDLEIQEVKNTLLELHKEQVIIYQPASDLPKITFMHPRVVFGNVKLDDRRIVELKAMAEQRMYSVLAFIGDCACREQVLLKYFNETCDDRCERCDLCKVTAAKLQAGDIMAQISDDGTSLKRLVGLFGVELRETVSDILSHLESEELISISDDRVFPRNKPPR